MRKNAISIYILILILISSIAFAESGGQGNETSNIFGNIQIGAALLNMTDELYVDNANKGSGDSSSYNIVDFFPLLDINYKVPNTDTTLYVSTPIKELRIAGSAGFKQEFDADSVLDVYFYKIYNNKAWKNPYVEYGDRYATGSDVTGVSMTFDHLLTTPFELSYEYKTIDIDNDDIGCLVSDLKRDGNEHISGIRYEFKINEDNIIIPGYYYTEGNKEGESNSFVGDIIKLTYKRVDLARKYTVNASIYSSSNRYKKAHPLYEMKRKDNSNSISIYYTRLEPLGYKDYFMNYAVAYGKTESNIEFFDSRLIIVSVMAGYTF